MLTASPTYIDVLIIAIAFLTGIVVVLLVYILVSLVLKNRRDSVHSKWRKIISLLIQNCLFSDEGEAIVIPSGIQKLLKRKYFRGVLIQELVQARKGFSGEAGVNLLTLYEQLDLRRLSLEKLESPQWYVKAQGIQELAHTDQHGELDKIYKLTNDRNELVRMEAQLAVVQLSGFEGLKFLENLTYQLSDWQQVNLLSELRGVHQSSSAGVDGWLSSNHDSVVIFALKLICIYQHFELYSSVVRCLSHSNAKVRFQAITTLKEIYTEETESELMDSYRSEDLQNKLKILVVLTEIGTKQILPFLFSEMSNESNRVKMEAARAISAIGSKETLYLFPDANLYPWNQIISQVEQELAA